MFLRAYADVLTTLKAYGETEVTIPRTDGRPRRRWSVAEVRAAQSILYAYIFGSQQDIEREECYMPRKSLRKIRDQYARLCVKFPEHTLETSGRKLLWFDSYYASQAKLLHEGLRGTNAVPAQPQAPLGVQQLALRRAYGNALNHLRKFGERPAPGARNRAPRWSLSYLNKVEWLIHLYFFGPVREIKNAEEQLRSETVIDVRRRFAETHVLNPGIRGGTVAESRDWFPAALAAAQASYARPHRAGEGQT